MSTLKEVHKEWEEWANIHIGAIYRTNIYQRKKKGSQILRLHGAPKVDFSVDGKEERQCPQMPDSRGCGRMWRKENVEMLIC